MGFDKVMVCFLCNNHEQLRHHGDISGIEYDIMKYIYIFIKPAYGLGLLISRSLDISHLIGDLQKHWFNTTMVQFRMIWGTLW
jgi:hypothetical protein